jgi:hypothetical protein
LASVINPVSESRIRIPYCAASNRRLYRTSELRSASAMAVSPTLLLLGEGTADGDRGLIGVTAFRCDGPGVPLTGRSETDSETTRLLDFFMVFPRQKLTLCALVTKDGCQSEAGSSRAEGFRDARFPGALLVAATSGEHFCIGSFRLLMRWRSLLGLSVVDLAPCENASSLSGWWADIEARLICVRC